MIGLCLTSEEARNVRKRKPSYNRINLPLIESIRRIPGIIQIADSFKYHKETRGFFRVEFLFENEDSDERMMRLHKQLLSNPGLGNSFNININLLITYRTVKFLNRKQRVGVIEVLIDRADTIEKLHRGLDHICKCIDDEAQWCI